MEILSWILRIAGLLLVLVGWFGVVREMFAESRGLGYMGFMIPIVTLGYGLLHWEDLKKPTILMIVGALLAGGGLALGR